MQLTGPYTIFFSGLCVAISLYNLGHFFLVRIKSVGFRDLFQVSLIARVKQITWTFLCIHAASAIYTTVMIKLPTFTSDTLASLLISCSSSLFFNVLCLWIMKMKLMSIAPQEAWIGYLLIFCIACVKVYCIY